MDHRIYVDELQRHFCEPDCIVLYATTIARKYERMQ